MRYFAHNLENTHTHTHTHTHARTHTHTLTDYNNLALRPRVRAASEVNKATPLVNELVRLFTILLELAQQQ